ncbi:MAG: hypothetical protein Q4P17_03905 [Methanobacterium sp.]|nr:hypothetical protein [Methanobacterium sp.]
MAGYKGYSMSNNAVTAYESGEKPFSKWTKSDIIETLISDLKGSSKTEIESALKKRTSSELKNQFLKKSSWHHTSKMYNRTDFYDVADVSETELRNYLGLNTTASSLLEGLIKSKEFSYKKKELLKDNSIKKILQKSDFSRDDSDLLYEYIDRIHFKNGLTLIPQNSGKILTFYDSDGFSTKQFVYSTFPPYKLTHWKKTDDFLSTIKNDSDEREAKKSLTKLLKEPIQKIVMR